MASNPHVEAQASALPMADSTVIDDDDEMLFGDDTELVSLSLPLATGQPYNRSITDPGTKQQKLSVFRARRMRTNPLIQGSTVRGSAETIATATFKTIIQNMEQYGLRTSHLWQHNFHWLLPKSGATQQQLKIFCALRDHPLIVPNGDLVRILDLEQSTESSPPTPLGTHFYVRSFELTHYQLTKVIKFMAKQDVLLTEASHWETTLLIHSNQAQSCTFTIRYVGKVSGPQRPIDRHMGDLAADARASGVLLEFVAAVEQLFPEVSAAAQVHLVKQASIEDEFGASFLAEDIERVLIEFFDHRSLLNRARGGFYVSFVPFAEDITLFERLRTRFYSLFTAEARLVGSDPQMAVALADHFEEVQAFANSHPSHTGTAQHPFTDGVREAARLSGEPMLYRGTTILLLLGKDITYEQYLGETTFFGGKARSGYLVRDFLSRLANTEESNMNPDTSWDPRAFSPRHLAFVDFWSWLWHSRTTLDDAIRFARQYLSIVRPLVVATCSRPITSIVRANFESEIDMPFGLSLSSVVGDITIQYYGSDGDENSAFLAIPQIHPGFEKYVGSSLSQTVLRFMDLTWQMTLHLADESRKLLDQDHANGVVRTRKAQCIEILRRINHLRASDRDMRAFMDNFRKVRNELRTGWSRLHRRPEFEDYRPILDEEGRARIAAIGRAEGLPNSVQRNNQLEALWSKEVQDLHLVIPHESESKQKWMDEFLGLAEGQLLFLQVVSGLSKDRYLQEMLARFRPDWNEVDSWLTNPEDWKKVVLSCGLWLEKKLIGTEKSGNTYHPVQDTKTKELQGLNVDFNFEGFFSIRWLKDDGSAITFRFKLSTQFIPERRQEVRALSFTEFGIDVVDAGGNAIRGFDPKWIPDATIPCSRFDRHSQAQDLWALWTAVRKAHGHPTSRSNAPAVVQWNGGKGVAPLSSLSKTETPKQNRPPHRLDALYLLNESLLERFPAGGTFRSARKESKPDSTEDLQAFVTFLKRPEYSAHPWATFWISCFDNNYKWDNNILGKNLAVLRRVRIVFTHTRHGMGKVAETSYILGPPGTSGIEEEEKPTSDDDNAGRGGQSWGTRRGVPFVDHGKKTEVPQQNRPPKRLDANWLLVEFLNVTFPTGGVFRTASRAKLPNSPDHVTAFLDFIRRPENFGHPYAEAFIKELDPPSTAGKRFTPPRINVLFNNIRVYRSCTKESVRTAPPGGGERIKETQFTVGAPGSALPYDASAVGDEVAEQQSRATRRVAAVKGKKKLASGEDSGEDEGQPGSKKPSKPTKTPVKPSKSKSKAKSKTRRASSEEDEDDDKDYEAPAPKTSSSRGKKRRRSSEDEQDDDDGVQLSKKVKKSGKGGRDAGKRSGANLVARKG
jgi:hypothetical protein